MHICGKKWPDDVKWDGILKSRLEGRDLLRCLKDYYDTFMLSRHSHLEAVE